MMWVISFIFIVVYSRSIGRFSSWNWVQVSHREDHIYECIFVIRAMSWCWCYVWSRCECQQWAKVHAVQRTLGTTSTTRHGIFRPPSLVRSLSHDPCQESLIVCQFFEQQAKLSSDLLHSLFPFHCSSRDSLISEHMVSNWCVITFLTEYIRKRSP